jgi:hypothetical protein
MIMLAYIALSILVVGLAGFGTLIVLSTIGHRRAWKEYKEHSRQMLERHAASSDPAPSSAKRSHLGS